MKLSWALLLVLSSTLFAADTSGDGFEKWWPTFQRAVAQRDAKVVADGANFPMNWENGPIREIKTEADLLNKFDSYFTGEIRRRVAARKPERLPSGTYILTWKARGNEYSLYWKPRGSGAFVLDGLSEGPP